MKRPGTAGAVPGLSPERRCYGLVQVTVGTELVPFAVPRNPKVVLAPAARLPFQLAFFTVTFDPLADSVPFHTWLSVWPLAYVHVTVQPVTAAAPAFTTTSPWN